MSIGDMFAIADSASSSIRVFQTGVSAAEEALSAARSQRLPDISVSASVSYLGNGVLWDRNFGNPQKIDIPHFGNNLAIEAQQVIYAGGAVSSGIEKARLEHQKAGLDLEQHRQDVRFMLVGYYLELYRQYNLLEVLWRNIALNGQVLEDMRARYSQGTVLRNDITRYELQRENLLLEKARVEDACGIMNYRLVTALHLPEGTEVVPDTALLEAQVEALDAGQWQELAAQNSLDLRQALTDIKLSEQQVRMERASRLPQIAVVAADHLDGPITIEVPVLNNNFNYWYVGLGIKYDISSLYKDNGSLRRARLNVRKARESYALAQEELSVAVQAGYVDFLTSFTDLRTQEKAVELADENYGVISNRYSNDLALLTDMVDAGNAKLNADMSLVNARIGVIYNYYKMKYLTDTL